MENLSAAGPNIGHNMLRIHRVISRGIEISLEHNRALASGSLSDPDLRQGLSDYTHCLLTVLDGHHRMEDDLVFPVLRERMPGAPFKLLASEHHDMLPVLKAASDSLESLTVGRNSEAAAIHLASALELLKSLWYPHIQREEKHFSPTVLAEVLEPAAHVEQLQRFADYSKEHVKPDYLIVPFMLFNLNPEDRARMSQGMPEAITAELVPIVWKPHWEPMRPFFLD